MTTASGKALKTDEKSFHTEAGFGSVVITAAASANNLYFFRKKRFAFCTMLV